MSTKRLALDNKTILTLWSWMTSSEIIEIHLHLPNRFCSMWKNDCSVDRVGKCAISQTRITCGPCQFQWKQPWTSTKLLRMKREKRQRRRLAESPVRWSWCDPWSASIAAFSLSLLPKKWITFTAVPSMQRPERQSIFQIGETLWKFSPQHFCCYSRSTRFATFPDHLLIRLKKFTLGADWTPKKLGIFRNFDSWTGVLIFILLQMFPSICHWTWTLDFFGLMEKSRMKSYYRKTIRGLQDLSFTVSWEWWILAYKKK